MTYHRPVVPRLKHSLTVHEARTAETERRDAIKRCDSMLLIEK